jgi:hypothetical protein
VAGNPSIVVISSLALMSDTGTEHGLNADADIDFLPQGSAAGLAREPGSYLSRLGTYGRNSAEAKIASSRARSSAG